MTSQSNHSDDLSDTEVRQQRESFAAFLSWFANLVYCYHNESEIGNTLNHTLDMVDSNFDLSKGKLGVNILDKVINTEISMIKEMEIYQVYRIVAYIEVTRIDTITDD